MKADGSISAFGADGWGVFGSPTDTGYINIASTETGFAFLIPEFLQRLNYPYYDAKNMWPLNYYFLDEWNIRSMIESGNMGLFMIVLGIAMIFIVSSSTRKRHSSLPSLGRPWALPGSFDPPHSLFIRHEARLNLLLISRSGFDRSYDLTLTMKPSEYWQRNCRATYQSDPIGVRCLDLLGEDNIMWGSDFPHPDGVWPDSQEFIAREMAGVPDAIRNKVVYENAARLYRFPY